MRKQMRSLIIVGLALGISCAFLGQAAWLTPAQAGESDETKELKILVKKLQDQLAKAQGELSEQQAVIQKLQQELQAALQAAKDELHSLEPEKKIREIKLQIADLMAKSNSFAVLITNNPSASKVGEWQIEKAKVDALLDAKKSQAKAEENRKLAEQTTRKALVKAKKAVAVLRAKLEAQAGEANETKELKALVEKLRDQLAKAQGELSEQKAVNKKLQEEALRLKEVQAKETRVQQKLQAVLEAVQAELQKALAISEQARKQAEQARQKAEQARLQALQEAKKAQAQAAKADAEQAALRAKLELLQNDNARLQKLLSAFQQQKIPQPGGEKKPVQNPPPVKIQGKVTKIDNNLILINLGSDHGLAKGHTLEVYRLEPQPKYLGTIRIVEVQTQQSIGMPTGAAKAELIKAGDQVSNSIPDGK